MEHKTPSLELYGTVTAGKLLAVKNVVRRNTHLQKKKIFWKSIKLSELKLLGTRQ